MRTCPLSVHNSLDDYFLFVQRLYPSSSVSTESLSLCLLSFVHDSTTNNQEIRDVEFLEDSEELLNIMGKNVSGTTYKVTYVTYFFYPK